jgi:hypothetical protein
MGKVAAALLLMLYCAGCAQRSTLPQAPACVPPSVPVREYLAYVKEEPLQPLVCEKGREVYRFGSYTFHFGNEAHAFRLDVGPDGRATITVRRTDFVERGTPPLVFDKSRMLTDGELVAFRKAFDASNYWALPTEPKTMPCLPDGMNLVEVVRDGRYHDRVRYCGRGEPSMDPVFAIVNTLDQSLEK